MLKLKIHHFITTISIGGAENQLLILARAQVKLGYKVVIYPMKDSLDLKDQLTMCGAEVDTRFHEKNIFKQIYISFKMNFDNYEILHAHLPLAEIIQYFSRCRIKITSRHFGGKFYPKMPRIVSTALSRIVSYRTTYVVAISDFVKDYLRISNEIPINKKIYVVKYGFKVEDFLNQKSQTIDSKHAKARLACGTLARLSPEKDLATLLKAIHVLKIDYNEKIEVNIYGVGPEEENLRSLVKKLHIDNQVNFKGKTNQPLEAFDTFEIFVLTSVFEGFGMVLLEAMSLGKKIVCSEIPAAKEILGNKGAGIFFETGNEYDLACKISNISNLLHSSYLDLQKIQLEQFSATKMAAEMDKIYLQALSGWDK